MILFGVIEIKWLGTMDYRIKKLILKDEPIKAIKLHREIKGSTLKDAKDYIDKTKDKLKHLYYWER
jgi:ribosomal protein L7/L12